METIVSRALLRFSELLEKVQESGPPEECKDNFQVAFIYIQNLLAEFRKELGELEEGIEKIGRQILAKRFNVPVPNDLVSVCAIFFNRPQSWLETKKLLSI